MLGMSERTKYFLDESALPAEWYNINADLPVPLAPTLNPQTLEPATPDDFAPLFPMVLILQEVSGERWIEIPEPVRDVYRLWRPTPLIRARRLE
jgi:tryptophan synthase beta chain